MVPRQRELAYTATPAGVHIGTQVFAAVGTKVFAVVGTNKSDERLKVRELQTAKPPGQASKDQRLCLVPIGAAWAHGMGGCQIDNAGEVLPRSD